MREYATDGERVGDGAEQCAVAVAIGAAQHVLTEYARDQLGPFVAGGAGVEFGDRLGRIVGSGGARPGACASTLPRSLTMLGRWSMERLGA